MQKQSLNKKLSNNLLRPLLVLIIITLGFAGWSAYHYMIGGFGRDPKLSHDLEMITHTITSNYLTGESALPTTLSNLHIKGLSYPVNSYSYKPLYKDMGSSAYQLCAQFYASQGLPFDGQYGNNGSFEIHRKGRQCFQITYFPNHGSSDIVPILNPNEKYAPTN